MNTTVIAVTGCNGFVGHHLVEALNRRGMKVLGLGREPEPTTEIASLLHDYRSVDLASTWPAMTAVSGIVHLAGRSNVAESFEHPQDFITENSAAVTNLGEHLLTIPSPPRTLVISSGAVYDPEQPIPIAESGRTFPSSPYAVSKLLVESQSTYYAARGAPMVTVRPFNHVGPGQQRGYLLPDLVHSAREAAEGGGSMHVGDLSKVRDYTDVRDVARAYLLLLSADLGPHRVFNVCSGTGHSGAEILEVVLRVMGQKDLEPIVDQSRLRPTDPQRIIGDNALLHRVTGWSPRVDLESTVRDFVASS